MIVLTDTIAPHLTRPTPLGLYPASFGLWRVLDARGRIVGHLERVGDDTLERWRARRLNPLRREFQTLGDFWSPDDALECIRYA